MTADYDPTIESTATLQGKLAGHVLLKGYQAGGLVGLLAVTPVQALLARSFSLPKALRTCGIASLAGVGVTGVLLAARLPGIDRAGFEDRVYRLHYNQGQNRCDTFSICSTVAGAGAAVAASQSGYLALTALNLLGSGAAASAVGVLLHVATSPTSTKQERKQMGAALASSSSSSAAISTSASALARPETALQLQQRDGPGGRRHEEQLQRHNVAMQNAPRKVFELIGDPRTGLADNVANNPFGEVTVDMVHQQESNQVYWYKYEFAGNVVTETHRDARLSEHAKNLIYLLRARNPGRWTIEALAMKFHVRRQRILAVLALKEMEAHRLEEGSTMGGPLSAYACPVYLEDVHLDQAGEPAERRRSSQGASVSDACQLEQQLPQLCAVAAEVQAELLQALQPYEYSLQAMRTVLEQQLSQIEQQLRRSLQSDLGTSGSGSSTDSSAEGSQDAAAAALSGTAQAAAQWAEVRRQLMAVLEAVEKVLTASDALQEEARLQQAAEELDVALRQGQVGVAGAAGASSDTGADPSPAAQKVAKVLEGWEGKRLLRLVLALAPERRKQLVDSVQRVSIDLNSQGVDFELLFSKKNYQGPTAAAALPDKTARQGAATTAAATTPLIYDVLGFRPVGDDLLEQLVGSAEALESAMAALTQQADGVAAGPAPAIGAKQLRQLLALRRTYLSADAMMAALNQASSEGEDDKRRAREAGLQKMKLLQEVDPSYPSRAVKYDQIMSLVEQRRTDLALLGLQELEGSEDRAQAVLQALSPQASAPNQFLEPDVHLQPGESIAPRPDNKLYQGSWDLMAAFIEHRVGYKVYNRGSGERHLVRLPTYPTFEGYTLEEFDRAEEGEISQLNREVAKREEEELYKRFRSNLHFNLGLVGQQLWDTSKPRPKPNLASALDKPLVVYGVNKAGETIYPPIKVVEPNGRERPLNEQETVFQERRRPLRGLPYQLQRIRRKTEIE